MHSQLALTEPVSLNLAPLILLDPVQWGRDRCNRRPKGSGIDTEYCNTDNTDCQCLNDLLDGAFPFLLEAVQLFVDTNCDNDRK